MRRLSVVLAACFGALTPALPAPRGRPGVRVPRGRRSIPHGGVRGPSRPRVDRVGSDRVSGRVEGACRSAVEGFFGRNTYDRNSNNGEGLGGALLFAAFRFGDRARLGPYLFGGLGGGGQGIGEFLVSWFPAISIGAGIEGPTSKLGFFAETRYTRNPDFSFFEVVGGLKIPLGNGR